MDNILSVWLGQRTPASLPSAERGGWLRLVFGCLVFAAVYGVAARVGLAYSSLAPNVTLIWAPTGISLFVVLRWGRALWPGIVIGDLIANAGTGAPLGAILGIAAGNVLQTLLCAWALRRVGFRESLSRVRDAVALLSLGTASAATSALVGPAALALAGTIAPAAYASVALHWWMGDATGVIVVTPLLLAGWAASIWPRREILDGLEAIALFGLLLALCLAIFTPLLNVLLPVAPGYYPAALALFPLAVWAALRFGLRGATLLTLLVSVAAVWGTLRGLGPFADHTQTSSLLRWWVFANVITVTSLLLATSQIERDEARLAAIRDRDFTTAILDAEGALVLVLDADWRIRRVNRAFESLTGFALADLVGQRFEQAVIPEHQHDKLQGHAELLRLNLSNDARHDSLLRRRKGPPVTVTWTTAVLRDNHRIAHVIVSGVDISARVEAAEALRHARRQLEVRVAERTRDLADANAVLKVQMAERQRLEAEIIHISEREQQRFGQELHDGLGQHLTATAIQAELLARDLEATGAPEATRSAQRIEAMVSDAVSQARLLARGLFPVELEGNGLTTALEQLVEHVKSALRRDCTLLCPRPIELHDHPVAIHVYRIAQEAVNNAIKHAPGCAVEVTLRRANAALLLDICNVLPASGAGRAPSSAGGMGLQIMRHRAGLIGAALSVGVVQGTWRVTLHVPDATSNPRQVA